MKRRFVEMPPSMCHGCGILSKKAKWVCWNCLFADFFGRTRKKGDCGLPKKVEDKPVLGIPDIKLFEDMEKRICIKNKKINTLDYWVDELCCRVRYLENHGGKLE